MPTEEFWSLAGMGLLIVSIALARWLWKLGNSIDDKTQ